MSDDKYESHIKAVLSECPDANIDEVKASFKKYEEEFYIPPQDALRSIVRRFQGEKQTTSPNKTTRIRRNIPAIKLESLPLPPDLILIIDCPIIAQPAIPPRNPVAVFAMPCPMHSWFRFELVSVRSSTICCVSKLSRRPTVATATEYGKIIFSVSSDRGISGSRKIGSVSGRFPISPTVLRSKSRRIVIPVSRIMFINGEGIDFVKYGKI